MNDIPPESSTRKTPSAEATRPKGRLPLGRVGTGLTVAGLALALGAGGLYLGRRAVAEEVLVGWLKQRGIAADVQVERIEWDGFTGRIIIGDPKDPDVRIDRVEVDYLIGLPWMRDGFGLTPKRVLLSQPLIKAEWTGEAFSLGSLDPLIEEFTSKPPSQKPGPVILVEKGQALITTPYGVVTALADARLNDSKLEWLKASLNPATLELADMKATGLKAQIEASTVGERLVFVGSAFADQLQKAGQTGEAIDFALKGELPYPRKGANKVAGPVTLDGLMTMARLQGEAASGDGFTARVNWNGQVEGWLDSFALKGRGAISAEADQLVAAGQVMSGVRLVSESADLSINSETATQDEQAGLRWRVEGPAQVRLASLRSGETMARNVVLSSSRLVAGANGADMEASGGLSVVAGTVATGDFDLQDLRGQFVLDARRGTSTRIALTGGIYSQASYSGLGPVKADDAPELVRLKQAASNFRLSIPSARVVQNNRGLALQLGEPARVYSANGADIRLTDLGGPLLQADGRNVSGAARLTMSGEGMPQLALDVSRWQWVGGGLEARLSGDGAMDFTPVRAIALQTEGTLSIRGGRTTYTADGCAKVQASQIDIGENALEDLSGNLCGGGKPLFTAANGSWTLAGQLDATRLQADFLKLSMDEGQGHLKVTGGARGVELTLANLTTTIADTTAAAAGTSASEAPPLRINPVTLKGDVRLRGGQWRGDLAIWRDRWDIGQVDLYHSNASQQGRLEFRTRNLDFVANGLQPSTISPLLSDYVLNAEGDAVSMDGFISWGAGEPVSRGQILIGEGNLGQGEGLSFDSPLGRLAGLRGKIVLDDLLKLRASDQHLAVDSIDSVVPVKNLRLVMDIQDGVLGVRHGELALDEGGLQVQDVQVPLSGRGDVSGRLRVTELQVNDLIKAAKLEDKARFDAKLSGTLDFKYSPRVGWDVTSIDMTANSGYLSIDHEVLTGLSAGDADLVVPGAPEVPVQPSAVEGWAYQALEALAIENLSASIGIVCDEAYVDVQGICVGEGTERKRRLAVDFFIKGYHDPAEKKELRISLLDIFNGNLMDRELPLPSGTPVILNLKTTWNADQIATSLYQWMQRRYDDLQTTETPVDAER